MRNGRLAVALFNDTGDEAHVGCLAVSEAHRRMLRRAGAVVRHVSYSREWRQFGRQTVESATAALLGCDDLRRVLDEVDAVVVNGEGTIHHEHGAHLLAILAAAQHLEVPTFLVNAVLERVDHAREVLARLADCTVRDACSAGYLSELGVSHRLVRDSFFEAEFLDTPVHDFSDCLVVTDVHPSRAEEFAPALRALRDAWAGPVAEYPLESPDRAADWKHAVADLRRARAVVTGRHHGACLALLAGVPFVTLPSNTWKIEGLLASLDGYPREAAEPWRPIADRVDAAVRASSWFGAAAERGRQGLPLATFDRLRGRAAGSGRRRPGGPSPDRRVLHAVPGVTPPTGRVLHCGAGDGALVRALLGQGIDAQGADVSRPLVEDVAARSGGRCSAGSPDRLPFADGEFATVVVGAGWLEHLDDAELTEAVDEIARVAGNTLLVEISGRPARAGAASWTPRGREWWEARLIGAGLRRHPRLLATIDFEELEHEPAHTWLALQKVPEAVKATYPLGRLATERDLHMDMLREAGRRSDAHLARYEWARGFVKPGDHVLDAACGLGYGTALLWDGTEAARVVGIDSSRFAVDYGRLSFSPGRPGVEFHVADVESWRGWTQDSLDCIVSFETLEHLEDPCRFVANACRALRPGGRFVCSVPNRWVDDSGRDPNPHHRHVFDLSRLLASIPSPLLVEQVVAQSAGGEGSRFHPQRLLRPVNWRTASAEDQSCAEWWLLSAIKDPVAGASVPYEERVFPAPGESPSAIAFERDYVNPWPVHAVVMGPFRARCPKVLRGLAERWLESSPEGSADAGAALCVLAYQELEHGSGALDDLLERIRAYVGRPAANPQCRRWQVSLQFVEGRLRATLGDLAGAEECFARCARQDAASVTPHLETKTTEAAWLAGRLALRRGEVAGARDHWRAAFDALERMRRTPVSSWLVTPDRPAAFETGDGLREIAMAVDNAALCANGLRGLAGTTGPSWRPGPQLVERNFQRTSARLLEEIAARGGAIQALRAAVTALEHEMQQGARRHAQELEAANAELRARQRALASTEAKVARLAAEGTAARGALRRLMSRRVVIYGTGEGGRRAWEAIHLAGSAQVVAFLASPGDERTRYLGCPVRSPEWLGRRQWEIVAVADSMTGETLAHLESLGAVGDRIVVLPVDDDDPTLARAVAERFPDPLSVALSRLPEPETLRVGIFGTGAAGMKVWEALADLDEAQAAWFADNDPAKQGRTLLWLEVLAPTAIPSRGGDAVIIGSMSREAIRQQLLGLGLDPAHILAPDVVADVAVIREQLRSALADLAEKGRRTR